MKSVLDPNHIPRNKYFLDIPEIPDFINFVAVEGLESEIDNVEMPDKTMVSGGRTAPSEFTGRVMLHDIVAVDVLQRWHEDCKDPADPFYKKTGILQYEPINGTKGPGVFTTFELRGIWPSRISPPDTDMSNEGEPQQFEVTFKVDEIVLLRF